MMKDVTLTRHWVGSEALEESTVIRFFFVVKIFSYRENVRKFFTQILFYKEIFSTGQVRTHSNDAVVDR